MERKEEDIIGFDWTQRKHERTENKFRLSMKNNNKLKRWCNRF